MKAHRYRIHFQETFTEVTCTLAEIGNRVDAEEITFIENLDNPVPYQPLYSR